jgi:hypothetical protein
VVVRSAGTNKVNETMQRRKFVVGLGSLAAGSATALGTGALTDTAMERGVRGRVAGDQNGFVQISPIGSYNGNHISFDSTTGEMYLDFGNIGSGTGKGLNADSLNRFDKVFNVSVPNHSGNAVHDYAVWVDSPSDRLNFYVDSQQANYIESLQDGKDHAVLDPVNKDTSSGSGEWNPVPVGIEVDLRDTSPRVNKGDDLTQLFDEEDEYVLHVDKFNND